ncbi:hypothetical protein TNCV_4547301 [Trichonephila clavipes]|nr:hypothetical protein TNCV_4547301 [Trichonephila clavipes]
MCDSSSFVKPTPLAHADTPRDILPRGGGHHTVSEWILSSHYSVARGLLATDLVTMNHGQVTKTTPELAPPLLTTTPHQWEHV